MSISLSISRAFATMLRSEKATLVSAILVVLAGAAVLLGGCARKADSPETVQIGAATQPVAGLVYIADEKGFFKQRGVNVAINAYEAGPLAVNALLADAVDVATAAEFVMVQKSFDNNNLRAMAQITNTNATELVARKGSAIEKLSDLKGKKIGLLRGSSSEFFLGTYLRHSNIPLSGAKIVNLAPSAAEEAIYNGSVDAVVIWEPYVTKIKERLGKNAISWPVQGRDDYYFLLIAKEEFIRRSPATVEKIVRAMLDAEDFVGKHPEEAKQIIEARLRLKPGDVQLFLARSTFKVRLDQALLTLMEAEANWMIRNKLISNKEMPNYLDMIYLKALAAEKPEAVGVIH